MSSRSNKVNTSDGRGFGTNLSDTEINELLEGDWPYTEEQELKIINSYGLQVEKILDNTYLVKNRDRRIDIPSLQLFLRKSYIIMGEEEWAFNASVIAIITRINPKLICASCNEIRKRGIALNGGSYFNEDDHLCGVV